MLSADLRSERCKKCVNLVELVKSFPRNSYLSSTCKIGVDPAANEPLKVWRRFNSFFQFTPYARLELMSYRRDDRVVFLVFYGLPLLHEPGQHLLVD